MKVSYSDKDRINYIDDMKVKYFKNGKIKSVGKNWFNYDVKCRLLSIGKMHVQYNRYETCIHSIGEYHIEYEYIYPYGYRIKQLVKYY